MDFLLTRADDHAVLGVRLTGFTLNGSGAVAGAGATILVITPPQHLDEQTVTSQPGEDEAVAVTESGTSRLMFAVAAGTFVPLTAEGVLAACTEISVDGTTATYIELPTRIAFKPGGANATVAPAPVNSPAGVSGVWLTRFAPTTPAPMTLQPLDPALASVGESYPTPLSALQRAAIVQEAAASPASITRLELTALGGSITANGEWTGLSWSHRATLGRDQFVRVAERVVLYPFGFTGVLTTVTERDPDANGVLPGLPAALYQHTTLRMTNTLLASTDGTALRRTFPFARVELLASVFGDLGAPVPDYTHVRETPDVSAIQDQIDSLSNDADQASSIWGTYVNGQNRTYDDLLRRNDPTALAYQNADDAFEPWAGDLGDIETADANAAPYLQQAADDEQQIDDIEQNAGPDGLSPDQQDEVNQLEADAQANQQQAQQYYVDPGYRQQVYANYNAMKPNVDALWNEVQQICATQMRDVSDALNLGDTNPDVSAAAQRYEDDNAAIAPLQDEISQDKLNSYDPNVNVTAWPTTASGGRVQFPVRLSRGDDVIDVTMPMMIIYDEQFSAIPQWNIPEYGTLSDPDLSGKLDMSWAGPPDTSEVRLDVVSLPASVVDFGGALYDVVGSSTPKPSDAQVINSVNIVAASADALFEPSLGRLAADGAQRWGLAVDLPALQKLAGPDVPGVATSAVVGFATDYVQNGEQAAALFQIVSGLGLDFTKAADRSGGLAALQMVPDGISRDHGPAQLAGLLANPSPAALIGDAAGLLGFKLTDLISALPQADLSPPAIVSDLADGNTPVVTLSWQHIPLQDVLAFKTNGKPLDDPARTELNLNVVSRVDGTVTDCVVNDFKLQFPFDDADALLRLAFASLTFHQQTTYGVDVTPGVGLGSDPSVSVDANGHINTEAPTIGVNGFGLEFLGPLQLLETLQTVVDLAGKQPGIHASPHGVTASFNLPVPDVGCGAFALSNVTFHSQIDVPFDGSAITVDVGFATRDKPFALSVLAFSGGGYIDVSIDAAGPTIDASLEFGASLSVDFIVAKGEVHAFGGVQYLQQGTAVTICGYLRIGGSLEILSLVSVSVELRIALTYANQQLVGRATLVLEIDLTLWSDKVEIDSGPWVLAGGSAQTHRFADDPPSLLGDGLAALAAVDGPVTEAELQAWQAYRASFTGGARA